MNLNSMFERAVTLGQQQPALSPQARLAQRAEAISLAGAMQAHLDACIGAMVALVSVLYATDGDNVLANVDPVTHRILIPVPWGRSGWATWGLRQWEAAVMSKILIRRTEQKRKAPPLFDYSAESRTWHLVLRYYTSAEMALSWLQHEGPDLREWRAAVNTHRDYHAKRMRDRR